MNIKKTIEAKSDQLNADDLIGNSKTIKITAVKVLDTDVQPVVISFDGDNKKPYKPSKGMRRVLIQLWGAESENFIGKKLTLYRDEDVKFGGSEVGGIRISHASGITEPTRVLETVSRGKRRPITIQPILKKQLKDVQKAKEAIEKGTYTFEQIEDIYELSENDIKILKNETV
jgi:hypothetical protein